MMTWIIVTALLALATLAVFELSVKTNALSLMCCSVLLFFATVVAFWVTADIASAAPVAQSASAAIPPDPRTMPREVHYEYVRLRDVFGWLAAILGVTGCMMFAFGAGGPNPLGEALGRLGSLGRLLDPARARRVVGVIRGLMEGVMTK